ncbi:Uncharacterised protein [Yersinia wautersii]|uniref:Uncharacterized protein n=1 Tax=Yersinia wautersii TaxID=1341643 RepID=A0ABM9TDP4_9GAMM|nr:Uncharacterised protein [Yersinia wautersii]
MTIDYIQLLITYSYRLHTMADHVSLLTHAVTDST